jgi:hypothetical protein
VLFDKICRKNGIIHRLTAPASPNQNGKVERFHGTLRPDLLDNADPFPTVEAAQAAVDAWVLSYNTDRPHQALNPTVPVTPADRFSPVPAEQRALLDLWLPASLETIAGAAISDLIEPTADGIQPGGDEVVERPMWAGGPVGRWAGGVRPGGATVGQPDGVPAPGLAGPAAGRNGGPVLGRLQLDPRATTPDPRRIDQRILAGSVAELAVRAPQGGSPRRSPGRQGRTHRSGKTCRASGWPMPYQPPTFTRSPKRIKSATSSVRTHMRRASKSS